MKCTSYLLSLIHILQVIEGGPAEDAGLKAGDIITAINGNEIDLTDFDEASSPIMGKEGTKVTVTILRDGVKKDYELTRSVIEQKYVRYSMLDNNIGYVYLAQFTISSIEQFENAVEELKKNGAESIIFDPVSYTHLDVYKRQGNYSCGCYSQS